MFELFILAFTLLHFIFLGSSFHLDRKLKEGHIPPDGKMCTFILKQTAVSFFLYRLLMPPKNYKYAIAKNENEKIAIKFIKIFYISSIACLIFCLFFIAMILIN